MISIKWCSVNTCTKPLILLFYFISFDGFFLIFCKNSRGVFSCLSPLFCDVGGTCCP
uniref:Uncharacterized protein n=1 Tax=Anguilla anguilla TaxID=7936 RepID=A0A0E9U9P3_ANGAN